MDPPCGVRGIQSVFLIAPDAARYGSTSVAALESLMRPVERWHALCKYCRSNGARMARDKRTLLRDNRDQDRLALWSAAKNNFLCVTGCAAMFWCMISCGGWRGAISAENRRIRSEEHGVPRAEAEAEERLPRTIMAPAWFPCRWRWQIWTRTAMSTWPSRMRTTTP